MIVAVAIIPLARRFRRCLLLIRFERNRRRPPRRALVCFLVIRDLTLLDALGWIRLSSALCLRGLQLQVEQRSGDVRRSPSQGLR